MVADRCPPSNASPQLQEAIDTVVQLLDYPESISIEYTTEGEQKQTRFEVSTTDGSATYELIYNGRDENAKPELRQIE